MNKGLEALEKLKQNNKDDSHLFDDELLDIIEKELKALEIISKSLNISVYHSRHTRTGYEMCIGNDLCNSAYGEITEEEYDLLKEVLL